MIETKKRGSREYFGARFPKETADRIKAIAKDEERTPASVVRMSVNEGLDRLWPTQRKKEKK